MSERCYRLVNGLGRLALKGLDIEVRATGLEHIPTEGPALLAATHVSFPDFVFIEKAAIDRGRYLRFMTRHDIWQQRPLGGPMEWMQHIPVDREAPAAAYLTARRLLGEGEAVCAFPEAGVSYTYTVRSLMRGVASLARETGVPVIPVGIWGSQRIYSVGRADRAGRKPRPDLTRGRRVDITFGRPMTVAPEADLTEWTRGLGVQLTGLLEEIQVRPHHRPRPGEWAPWYPAHLGGAAPTRHEARELDSVPRSSVLPTWGPQPCDPHEQGALAAAPAFPAG